MSSLRLAVEPESMKLRSPPHPSRSGSAVQRLRLTACAIALFLLARPLRHPAASPRLHQACDPAKRREQPEADPCEARGDHQPATDPEPYAPVDVQCPLST